MLVNKTFDRVTAYLLPKRNIPHRLPKAGEWTWNVSDLIYDFLQVLLINYFAQRNQGIFTHSIGVKDLDGSGLLFTGKSGCGKTTTAKFWHKHSKAMVLNDDRIIVRKNNGKFFIYGSPWHGEFSDYLQSRIDSALLERIFFIYHSPQNTVKKIFQKEVFDQLYPALFPTFWDKKCLENIVSFCQDLIKNVPCYSLGFVNDKKIIEFVRRVK
jgi:DNA polymerase III delta prime subunit